MMVEKRVNGGYHVQLVGVHIIYLDIIIWQTFSWADIMNYDY